MRKKQSTNRMPIWAGLIFLLLQVPCSANPRMLSKDAFVQIVRTYHPVIAQAGLQVARAGAGVTQARGAFDPTIAASVERKELYGKLYYQYFNPQVTIPTWYGIDIKAGVEDVSGERVNPQATVGELAYLGIKFNPATLVFDKQRLALRQAQTMQSLSEAEQKLAVNNLLFDAISAYWNWVREYRVYQLIAKAVAVNEERLHFVKIEFEQGSRPAIDTTETLAQLQQLYLQQSAAYAAFQVAGFELSGYLWQENNTPSEWDGSIIPDNGSDDTLINTTDVPALISLLEASPDHPKVMAMGYKIEGLQLEKKWKSLALLPKFSLSGNMLSKGYKVPTDFSATKLEHNHKAGIDFSMPIFVREARGSYAATKFKLQEAELEQKQATLQVQNKIKSYYTEVLAIRRQVEIFNAAYNNYRKLYDGEKLRFEVGESSLFLLNARENKLLETSQKLAELTIKWHKVYAGLLWATARL